MQAPLLCLQLQHHIKPWNECMERMHGKNAWNHRCILCPGGMHGRILRPLLSLHKADLVEICRYAGLPWVEDPTNANTNFSRNRLRAVLKQLEPTIGSQGYQQNYTSPCVDAVSSSGTKAEDTLGDLHQPEELTSGGETSSGQRTECSGALRRSGESARGVSLHENAQACSTHSITADVLRLVGACSQAATVLTGSADAIRQTTVIHMAEDWSECSIDTSILLGAGKFLAVRCLAAVLQVHPFWLA